MYDKILAALVAKHPGLAKEVLASISKLLEKKITEETEIEAQITKLEESPLTLTEIASLTKSISDKRVTDAVKTNTEKLKSEFDFVVKKQAEETKPEDPKPQDDGIAQQLAELAAQLKEIRSEKTKDQKQNDLHAKMKEKGIPAVLAKGRSIAEDQDLDALVAELETDWKEIKQNEINDQIAAGTYRPVGGTGGNGKKETSKEELDAIMNNLN